MEQKPYHHGDLKRTLIEAGITLLSKEGETQFSLRKVAAYCGVSHAAPYNHFKDKDDLINSMKEYVMERLSEYLEECINRNFGSPDLTIALGCAYVRFFLENPLYYGFIITYTDIQIAISDNTILYKNFRPFEIFKVATEQFMQVAGTPKEQYTKNILTMWAVVQGLTSIFVLKGVTYDGDLNLLIEEILREKVCIV